MNSVTGEISLLQMLDREAQDQLTIDVIVEDGGVPRLNDTAQVTLFIADENDNSPVIHPNAIEISIKEVLNLVLYEGGIFLIKNILVVKHIARLLIKRPEGFIA